MKKTLFRVFFMCALGMAIFLGGAAFKIEGAVNYWAEKATPIIVTDDVLNTLIDERADGNTEISERINGVMQTYTPKRETYHPNDRQWQGLPSTIKVDNRLWSVWYTGGNGEPRQFNYLVIAYSDDSGKSWVDPYIVIDHDDPNHDGVSLGVPNFFIDEDGNMCLIWIQYYTWILRFKNPGAKDIKDVVIGEPEVFTSTKMHKPPTYFTDSDGSLAMIIPSEHEAGGTNHPETTRFYVSKNKGQTWTLRSNLQSTAPNNRVYPESQIVELSPGNLMVMSRIEKGAAGGIEIARSSDYGVTFSPFQSNLKEPFIGPGSKFHIMKLSSGNILIVNHSTTSSRESIYAYLSTDNGETFPYKLPIDKRTAVTYPFAYEYEGEIYVSWDKGRFNHKEIRFAVFTESDIIAGDYLSEGSVKLGITSKINPIYKDIVSINDAYNHSYTYPVGTESSVVREKLPTSFKVKDNQDNEYDLTGTWKSPGYKADEAGIYEFTFQTSLPLNVEDTYEYFTVRVTIEETNGGDNGDPFNFVPIIIGSIGLVVVIGIVVLVIVARKKKRNR